MQLRFEGNQEKKREFPIARKSVQFQKGISLSEFLSTEPKTYASTPCIVGDGPMASCVRTQLNSRKLQQCNRCHRQTSITAGIICDSTKLPLTVWFQAIYRMTQDKNASRE